MKTRHLPWVCAIKCHPDKRAVVGQVGWLARGVPGFPGELGWVEALNSGPIFGEPTIVPNYWQFTGRLMLPAPRGSQPMRFLVQEYETYIVDREYFFAKAPPPKGSRVVYADALEV